MDLTKPKETVFQFRTYYDFLNILDGIAAEESATRTDIIHKAVLQYENKELTKGNTKLSTITIEEKENCKFPRAWNDLPDDSIVVYIITNKETKHQYIGSTIHGVKSRLTSLLSNARRGSNEAIARAFRKYGADSFDVDITPCDDEETARNLEKYYVDTLDTMENGYNNAIPHDRY